MSSVIENVETDSSLHLMAPTEHEVEIARLRKKMKNMRRELRRLNRENANLRMGYYSRGTDPNRIAMVVAEQLRGLYTS